MMVGILVPIGNAYNLYIDLETSEISINLAEGFSEELISCALHEGVAFVLYGDDLCREEREAIFVSIDWLIKECEKKDEELATAIRKRKEMVMEKIPFFREKYKDEKLGKKLKVKEK